MKRVPPLLCLLLMTTAGHAEAAPDGAAVFAQWCAHCHDAAPAAPGRLKLAWTRGADRSLLAERTDLNAAYIHTVVRRGQAEMPSFRRTEISDAELQALSSWLTRARAENAP